MTTAEQPAAPRKRREQQRAVDTKLNIVMAALAEFADKGFEAASIRTIAERTGLKHQLITYHFQSKQALWEAVAVHIFANLDWLRSERSDDALLSPIQKLRLEYFEIYQTTVEHPEFHHFMLRENRPGSTRLRWISDQYLKPHFARLSPLIKAAQRAGDLPKGEPILLHYMVVSMITTLTAMGPDIEAIAGVKPTEPKTIQSFWKLIEAVLFKPRGG